MKKVDLYFGKAHLLGRAQVRIQQSFGAPDDTEPDPDVALVSDRDCEPHRPARLVRSALSALVAIGIAMWTTPSSGQATSSGYTPGQLDVGPMGSATVTIPIEVAPGTQGLQPQLAIAYDSHNGANGSLGIGFGLRGLSVIHRCPKTLFDHGERGRGATTSERLCLDGQPLLSESGATDDNGYWSSIYFRTAHESGVRVQRRGSSCQAGVCYFEVHQPSGAVVTYGRNGSVGLETMVAGFGSVEAGNGNATQAWLIRQIADTHGNRMTYEYELHESSNYPVRITYGARSVELVYEDKTYPLDIDRSSYPAFERAQSRRLMRIEARVQGGTFKSYELEYDHLDDSAGQPGPSQLVRVQECDGAGTCHEPLDIGWLARSRNDRDLFDAPNQISALSVRHDLDRSLTFGDFDGRGRPSMLWSGSTNVSGNTHRWRISRWNDDGTTTDADLGDAVVESRLNQDGVQVSSGDFNGDGRTDLVTQLASGSAHTVQIHLSRGADSAGRISFDTSELTGSENGVPRPMYNNYHLVKNLVLHTGDFNGDGLTDLMRQERGGADNDLADNIQVYLSNGDSTFRVITPGQNNVSSDQYQSFLRYDRGYRIYPGDHNGDGLTDFMAVNVLSEVAPDNRYLRIFISKGDGTFDLLDSTGDSGMRAQHLNIIPGDFNGDGKADFIRQEKGAWALDESHTFRLYLSRGDGTFFKTPSQHRIVGQNMSGDLARLLPGDFNGDGKTDFARQVFGPATSDPSDAFGIFYSLGNGELEYIRPASARLQTYMRYDYGSTPGVDLFVGDFNGDGQSDVISQPREITPYSIEAHSFELHCLQADSHPNHLVTSLRSGNGMTTEVSYFSIVRGGIQQSGTPYVHAPVPSELVALHGPQLRAVSSGLHVVQELKRYATEQESATAERQTFVYEGMVVDAGGVGPVGFQRITTTHHARGTEQVKSVHVDPDFRGLLETDELYAGGELLSRDTFTWEKVPASLAMGTHFVRQLGSVKATYEGGELTTSVTRQLAYDSQNNPIWDRRIEGSVVRATTCRAFDQANEGAWHRGRILSETIVAGSDCTLSGDTCSCGGGQLLQQKALAYDSRGDVIEERSFDDESGAWEVTTHAYDARGNRTSTSDPAGVVTTYAYDAAFDTLRREVVDPAGAHLETTFVFDPRFGRVRLKRGPNGVAVIDDLDGFGRLVTRMFEPAGDRADDSWSCIVPGAACGPAPDRELLEEVSYLDVGVIERTTRDQGRVIGRTRIASNHRDQELRRELVGPFGETLVRIFDYDRAGRVIGESDPHFPGYTPESTRYAYDARSRPISVSAPGAAEASIEYRRDPSCGANEVGVRTTMSGENGVRETLECRDLRNEVTRRRYGAAAGTTPEQRFAFDAMGRLTRAWSPDASGTGAVLDTVYRYDALGRRVEIANNERGQTHLDYENGRLVAKSHDSDFWTYEHDSAGRRTAEVLPDGTRHETSYDSLVDPFGKGLPSRVRSLDPSGEVTSARSYAYDAFGSVLNEAVEVHGRTYAIGYTHRSDGVLEAVTYPDGSRLDVGRDQLGNMTDLTVEEDADGAPIRTLYAQLSDYSVRGQPGRIAFGNGVTTDYSYDSAGRLRQVTTSSQSGAFVDKVYTWSDFGEVTDVVDRLKESHSQHFTYDELGYLTEAIGAYGTRAYAYDAHGNLTQKGSLGLTYDGGRLVRSSQGDVFEYDARGNRSAKHTAGGASVRYRFSGLDQLTEVERETRGVTCDPDPQVLCADIETELLGRYVYDATGARVKKTDVNGVVSLYVSPLYEVTILPNGTELHTRYLQGPAGRIVAISDEVQSPASAGGTAQAAAWTSRHPPITVSYGLVALLVSAMAVYWARAASRFSATGRVRAGVLAALRTMNLVGDGLEARWSAAYGTDFMRRRRGFAAAVPLCSAYIAIAMTGCGGLSGDDLVKLRGGEHGVERLDNGMLFGRSSLALLPGANGGGYPVAGAHFFHPDHLGSSTYVTDALGHKVAETVYTPYGEVFDPASTGADVFRSKFSGKELDAGADLYYFDARHYDPEVGRFIQADTMVAGSNGALASDLNRYAYAGNNPVVFTDPSGRFVFVTVMLTALAVGLISGAVGVGVTIVSTQVIEGRLPSWKEVGIAFAVGFVSGAITGGAGAGLAATSLSFTQKAVLTVAANYAGGFLGTVTEEMLKDGDFQGSDWIHASVNGMVDALTASVIDVPVSKGGDSMATVLKGAKDKLEAGPMVRPAAGRLSQTDVRLDALRQIENRGKMLDPLYGKIQWWTEFNDAVLSLPGTMRAVGSGIIMGSISGSTKSQRGLRHASDDD